MQKQSLKVFVYGFLILSLVLGLGIQFTSAEAIEPVAVSIVVNSSSDEPDAEYGLPCETAVGNGVCTLRAAIKVANDLQSINGTLITFDIEKSNAYAPTIINIGSALPLLMIDGTIIQGPNLHDDSALVLDGHGGAFAGLEIRANNCAVKNLVIAGFGSYGIKVGLDSITVSGLLITGNMIGNLVPLGIIDKPNAGGIRLIKTNSAVIGGETAAERNIIAGNSGFGIYIQYGGTNVIKGNYIGVKSDGVTALSNTQGIYIYDSSGNTVGGNTAAKRNIISGNTSFGVFFEGGDNILMGNYIGTDASGTVAIPNDAGGVRVGNSGPVYSGNQIGGSNPGEGNLISGNAEAGLALVNTDVTTVRGNIIGLDVAESNALPNQWGITLTSAQNSYIGSTIANAGNIISGNERQGIFVGENVLNASIKGNAIGVNHEGQAFGNGMDGIKVQYAQEFTIGGVESLAQNTIAHNVGNGVEIESAYGQIVGNNLFDNGELGIDVWRNSGQEGVTPNDANEADDIQNYPVLQHIGYTSAGAVELVGQVVTLPTETLKISVYGSDACDPSRFGEGQTYLGMFERTSNASGVIIFDINLLVTKAWLYYTTTAWSGSMGPSEFSACMSVYTYLPVILR